MAALGLVHVVRRHQDRGAGVGELEQPLPEIAPRFADRPRWSARRGTAAPVRGCTAPASASRCFWPPLSVPASCCCRSSNRYCWISASMRCARRRARDVLDGGEELEVLAHGEVLVQREPLRHVADARAQRLGLARHLQAQHLDARRRSASAGRTACGSSSTCPSRSARGSRSTLRLRQCRGRRGRPRPGRRSACVRPRARMRDGSPRSSCAAHVRQLDPHRQARPAASPHLRSSCDLGQVTQARGVLADQRVVRREARARCGSRARCRSKALSLARRRCTRAASPTCTFARCCSGT